jgi:DNA-binding beta-propeller fold protein YncE
MTCHSKIARCIAVLAAAGSAALLFAGCDRAPPPTAGPAADAAVATAPRIVDGFASPESVASAGARHFVSNMGGKPEPTRKDGDGYISELDAQGTVVKARAFPRAGDPPLNAPKGMAVIGNRLYVTDIDRIVGYDITSHKQVFEAVVSGGPEKFFNDLAVESATTLLMTDTLRNALYRYDFDSKKLTLVAGDMPGANGVAVDGARKLAYVAAMGAKFAGGDLYSVPLGGDAEAQRIGAVHGLFDGIALVDGQLLLSDWKSVSEPVPGTMTLHAPDGTLVSTMSIPELHGPADFDYDAAQRLVWIPDMQNNRVVILPLPR